MMSVGIRVGARGSTAVASAGTAGARGAHRSAPVWIRAFHRSGAGAADPLDADPVDAAGGAVVAAARASLRAVLAGIDPDDSTPDVVVDLGPVLLDGLLHASRPPGVSRVCAVRLGPGGPTIRAPFEGWPADVRSRLDAGVVIADGGVDVFGTALAPMDAGRVAAEVLRRLEPGVAVAVAAVGAVVSAEVELAVADALDAADLSGSPDTGRGSAPGELGRIPVVLSHTVGGLRLLERENTALLQAALLAGARDLVDALSTALSDLCGRLAFTLADGSRTTREQFAATAVRSLGGREAAQLVGAATLAGVADAVVLVLPASVVGAGDQPVRVGWVEAGRPRVEQLGTLDSLLGPLPLTLAQAVSVTTTLAEVLSAPEVWLASTADRIVVADAGAGPDAVDRAAQLLRRTGRGPVTVVHPLAATLDVGLPDASQPEPGLPGAGLPAAGLPGARAGDVLSAIGLTAYQAVADLERIVATDDAAELDAVLGSLTELATSRVLGADGDPGRLQVLERRAAPLSFLRSSVHLVRVRVAAPITAASPASPASPAVPIAAVPIATVPIATVPIATGPSPAALAPAEPALPRQAIALAG